MQLYSGIVQKGIAEARKEGHPTLNIPLMDEHLSGIYAAEVTVEGKKYAAAAYANHDRKILEAHMLDFEGGELYGKTIVIELHKKIREAMQFANEDEARRVIASDVAAARRHFNS